MPLRPFSRDQAWLLPPTLDHVIPADHPVRFVLSLIDSLDRSAWAQFGIDLDGEPLGAPAYHPRILLAVWLYGFMTHTRSSRKLEAACRDQIPYLYLTGRQYPDHNTLWRFYQTYRCAMHHLFTRTVRVALRMGLVDLALAAVDGSKVAANAALDRTFDAAGLARLLERTQKAIEDLEKENQTGTDPPPAHLPERLQQATRLQTEVTEALAKLAAEEGSRLNLTDEDAVLMKTRQGIVPGYNVQAVAAGLVVDEQQVGMLVTALDVVHDTTDAAQLVPMLEHAEHTTGTRTSVLLADAGYHSGAALAACEEHRQVVVMPESQDKALTQPYHKDQFRYDAASDCYTCPQGQVLRFVKVKMTRQTRMRLYRAEGRVCRACPAFGTCTKSKHHGRTLEIGPYEGALRRHREWMTSTQAQQLKRRRKELIEPVFGIMKEQLGLRRCLVRGIEKVKGEIWLLGAAFNVRMLSRVWQRWGPARRDTMIAALNS